MTSDSLDRPALTDVVVTPAMIEAAIEVAYSDDLPLGPRMAHRWMEAVLLAALQAQRYEQR